MRAFWVGLHSLPLLLGVLASVARAEQPRDWMLDGGSGGNRVLLDYFFTGAQATLEHRGDIYGDSNSYSFNVSSLLGFSGGQVQATASLRVLFLEFSGTVGYRSVWRNLSFEPGDNGEYCKDCDRAARRDKDQLWGSGPDTDDYPYAEGTLALYLPLNEAMLFASTFSAHYEDGRPRSYDQFYMNLHDGGMMWISETNLFFRHRKWGAISPYVQVLSLPRDDRHVTQVALGFNAVTRVGLVHKNDALLLSMLFRPTDELYGQHSYYLPMRLLLVYRLVLEL